MAEVVQPHADSSGTEGIGRGPQIISTSQNLQVFVGPLLNYRRTSNAQTGAPTWHGSVLIVTSPGQQPPQLTLSPLSAVAADEKATFTVTGSSSIHGEKLYEDKNKAFWRFMLEVPFQQFESRWQYSIEGITFVEEQGAKPHVFAIPSVHQSMRIMFHSCNGFSVGTDVDAWSGPALWHDVLRMHEQKPFHVMLGGGDQIYNDGVRVDGPLKPWTAISNPHKRREFPFDQNMRDECDEYYYKNYVRWYGTKPFSTANGQIPQVNIWDDHDIIDGFGSYTDRFMRCAVFRGIGGVAHKYYLLFQHHQAPPVSTYTTDAPKTTNVGSKGTPADPIQLKDTFVKTDDLTDPSFMVGGKPGPYIEERSRSIYCQLGARIAFCGIDARSERTRHQINYPETYRMIFDRLNQEFSANRDLKHLVLLLGVPIAYPRLQWLENILSSPIIGPIKFLNKRFGFAGGLFNQFDGSVDLLDDLDDHYTAHQHKHERRELIHMLQKFSKQHSVRVTILGGDVHLAAVGRFFSNQKLGIPAENDHRYMPNVISSAITNKPPPQAVANLLAKRNKMHHLDSETDETLLEIFDRDPKPSDKLNGNVSNGHATNGTNGTNGTHSIEGEIKKKTADANHATMPSRNYAIISESQLTPSTTGSAHDPQAGAVPTATTNGVPPATATRAPTSAPPDAKSDMRKAMHVGEQDAGTMHPAAGGLAASGLCGQYGLDVSLRVEISPSDREGRTDGYGFSIPALTVGGVAAP